LATDNLVGLAGALLNAYTSSASVTPSDGTDLTNVTRALFIGGAGNLVVIDQSGNTTTFTGVAAGTLLTLRVTRVKATGTTATNIVALW
jgi:hypothetical protein